MLIRTRLMLMAGLILGWNAMAFGYRTGPSGASNGIFGQAACNAAGCHTGNQLNAPGGSLSLTGLPSNWTPGQIYPLTVTVSKPNSGRYGFQLSAVSDTANTQAGSLTSTSSRVQIITSSGVQYAEHNESSTFLPPTGVFTVNWTAPSSAAVGSVRFNLAANAANGDLTNDGDFIYTRVDRVSAAAPAQTFYYPQVADGVFGGVALKTTIFLFNPSTTVTATGTVTFTQSDGSTFPLPMTDETGALVSSGNTISFSLLPGGSHRYVSFGTQPLLAGYATVTSSSTINGTAVFSQFDSKGALTGEAGVPAVSAVARQSIVVDRAGGFQTGVAFANPGTTNASISLQLLNINGAAVLPASTTTLVAGQHRAAYIGLAGQLFENAPQFVGTMQIISTVPLAAIALRYDASFTHFTTLPTVPLASNFRELLSPLAWLERGLRLLFG